MIASGLMLASFGAASEKDDGGSGMKNWRLVCMTATVGLLGLGSSLSHAAFELPPEPSAVAASLTPSVLVTPGPGATATTSLTFQFLADYDFNAITLVVDYDAGLLQFNRGASTVSLFAPAASTPSNVAFLPAAVALFEPDPDRENNNLDAGTYVLNAFLLTGVPLPQGSKLVLNGVFDVTGSFGASTSTQVTISGSLGGRASDPFTEDVFPSMQTTVSAVPEPETWMLLLGGLGLIASRVRRASKARTDNEAVSA
jgi:hypothetical protein